MEIQISFKVAIERHFQAVEEIMTKLSKGKSKEKGQHPENFEWFYSYCVQVQSLRFDEMIASIKIGQPPNEPKGIEAKIADLMNRTGVSLGAKLRQWNNYSSLGNYIPPEIEEQYRQQFEKQAVEQRHIDSLTPEEKDLKTEKLLRQLRKQSGFMELHIVSQNSQE